MNSISLPIRPKEAVGSILKALPNKRLRDVIEKRFGIKGASMTLDAIGKSYGITRERVRQIENDAVKHLKKSEASAYLAPVFRAMYDHIKNHGGVVSRTDFIASVGSRDEAPHIELLLHLSPDIKVSPETDDHQARVYVDKDAHLASEKILKDLVSRLDAGKKLLSFQELATLASDIHHSVSGQRPAAEILATRIGISKNIRQNPYQEFGLVSWPTVQPKSIRDKAYVVLMKAGKPMHFQEVASAIDKSGFRGKKKAHPQTVHNELIKDSQRFVLVGRGLYALKEWGYQPGTVKDVIQDILRKESKGMTRDQIIQAVKSRRFVKENTILLNLQNKTHFKKGSDGTYFLA